MESPDSLQEHAIEKVVYFSHQYFFFFFFGFAEAISCLGQAANLFLDNGRFNMAGKYYKVQSVYCFLPSIYNFEAINLKDWLVGNGTLLE